MLLRGSLYILILLIGVVILAKVRTRWTRQIFLLVASYTLYALWGPWFTVVLLFSTLMNFLLGQWLRKKRSLLWIGILLNLALLASFKYLPAAASVLPFASLQRFSHLILPLGISFWTFQAMSYLFDLYRGEELDPTLVEFALYMVFFPIAISGPICRMPEMLPQLRSEEPVHWRNIGRGVSRIAVGILMMQLAQLLGRGVLNGEGITAAFDHLTHWSGPDVLCLAFGYGLQLFFDFAGYSHIAIGAAKVLGFTLPENFARPFTSTSVSVFWTRWHMSLSSWIRDYVFLLLVVLRREGWWRNLVFVISMVLFGLWHKASVLFLLWGCYHGVLLVLHRQWQELQRRFKWDPSPLVWVPISWISTMTLVSCGWILFRANSLIQVRIMLRALLTPATYLTHFLPATLYMLVAGLALAYTIVLIVIDILDRYCEELARDESPGWREILVLVTRDRWVWIAPIYALTTLVVVWVVTRGQNAGASPFMYRLF